MSKDDIDKAVKEAAAYEAEDKKRKEAIDARNEADSMVFQIEKALRGSSATRSMQTTRLLLRLT